jgi:glycosyltransferase involved in cell wall biosynthesis
MTLIEAGALGVPVIAGRDSGAVPWVVGAHGLLVDVRSPEALARAMLDLGQDEPQRRDLAAAAARAVRDRFDIGRITDRYEEIFADLARPG